MSQPPPATIGMALADVDAHVALGEGRAAGQGEQGDGARDEGLFHDVFLLRN